jgi:YD repeat-containing protein
VGTFYFTSRVSQGEATPDALGRTFEVHGPCDVADETAQDCPGEDYPFVQYDYWPESDSALRRNRLKSTSTFASRSAAPEVVTQTAYDSRGNATELVDGNGITTRLTYDENRLVSRQVGSQPATRYIYDGGRFTAIQFPAGNYEVLCYRKGTTGTGCEGGTLGDQLQWKAKAADAAGAVWSEKIAYTYWPDGTSKEEAYWTWTAAGPSFAACRASRPMPTGAQLFSNGGRGKEAMRWFGGTMGRTISSPQAGLCRRARLRPSADPGLGRGFVTI